MTGVIFGDVSFFINTMHFVVHKFTQ